MILCKMGEPRLRDMPRRTSPFLVAKGLVLAIKDKTVLASTLQNLGIAYKQKGTLKSALSYFEKAAKVSPGNTMNRLHLAETLFRLGDKKKAFIQVGQVISMTQGKKALDELLVALLPGENRQQRQPLVDPDVFRAGF